MEKRATTAAANEPSGDDSKPQMLMRTHPTRPDGQKGDDHSGADDHAHGLADAEAEREKRRSDGPRGGVDTLWNKMSEKRDSGWFRSEQWS
jgi:hypothetical protein